MVKKNTCVFISGKGTNLKNLINKSRDYTFPINIKLVISNNKNAPGLIYAKKNSIPHLIINTDSRYYENIVLRSLKKHNISLICLAGYMKIISKNLINIFKEKIVNIHPSLLPKYKGLNTFKRIIKDKEARTGCTVHYVNEKLDSGTIINKKYFYINSNDTVESLKVKTQNLEYLAFPEAIIKMFRNI